MKNLSFRFFSLTTGLVLAFAIFSFSVAAHGQPAAPEQPRRPAATRPPAGPNPAGESQDLTMARVSLQAALQKYGDQHPQVVELQNRIAALEAIEPKKINLDFRGGSFAKLMDAIAEHPEVSFSLVAAEEAGDLGATSLPAFTLRNATIQTVMEVVRNLLIPRGFQLVPVSVEKNSVICTLQLAEGSRRPRAPRSDFESYQLAPYLADQTVDDIVAAIRTAWELDPAHDRDSLKIKYHPPTTMLLVSAPGEGINLVRNILRNLKRGPNVPEKPPAPAVPPAPEAKP